jgi:hypothetical protein
VTRTPKNYDGPGLTSHRIRDVAPAVLRGINSSLQERPDLVLKAWSVVVGAAASKMTEAVSFNAGILVVKVTSSTLLSLLTTKEKPRLLTALRRQLSNTTIHDIVFRMS